MTDIRYTHGTDNPVADALSRVEVNQMDSSSLIIDFEAMASAQHDWQPCPVVPPTYRQPVFHSLHSLSHPGVRASQKLIASRFVWPKMRSDIKRWTQACLACQLSKVHRHTSSPLSSFPVPDARFDNILWDHSLSLITIHTY